MRLRKKEFGSKNGETERVKEISGNAPARTERLDEQHANVSQNVQFPFTKKKIMSVDCKKTIPDPEASVTLHPVLVPVTG